MLFLNPLKITVQIIESRKVWQSKSENQFWASDLSPGSQSWSADEGVIKDCAIKEQSTLSLGQDDDDEEFGRDCDCVFL